MPTVKALPTRPAVAAASLLLFTVGTVAAGDALAQRNQADSRGSDREPAESPAEHSAKPGRIDHGNERDRDQKALSAAVRRVERRTGGQVLSAERVPYDGRDINRIKVVDASGRVRVYVDDPRNRAVRNPPRTRDDDN